MVSVGVIDYGRGNLHSICNALKSVGAEVQIISVDGRSDIGLLVLPGVGAFAEGMRGLRCAGLDEFTHRFVESGRPVLGICLGSQMLMSRSEEFGTEKGLDLIPGRVVRIPDSSEPIPHIGWKPLRHVNFGSRPGERVFPSVVDGVWGYFVHSFHCEPDDRAHLIAQVSHGENEVSAIVGRDNVFGFQFHPEKSGPKGLMMLRDFLEFPGSMDR